MPSKPQRPRDSAKNPTRRVRYSVAMSLDGYIAGPDGEADWIVIDPEIDFDSMNHQFDAMVMGRKTFEAMKKMGGGGSTPEMQVFVVSRTLRQEDHPQVTIAADPKALIDEIRSKPGKDVWLFGGGSLFRSLAELGLVDTVEVGVIPVLLGAGVPLLPSPAGRITLKLTRHQVFPKTGTISSEYAVQYKRKPKHAAR